MLFCGDGPDAADREHGRDQLYHISAKYGVDMAVASMSILNSVMQFVMLLLPGLVQGAQPLLSYNLGEKLYC